MIEKGVCYLGWSKEEDIRERGENGGFVTALLSGALESGFLDDVLVVKRKSIYEGIPVITRDVNEVKESAGSLHAAPLNLAKKVVDYYRRGPRDRKIGLPAKPCDARSLIEQRKRQQIPPENVYMIGLNCGGTMHPLNMRETISSVFGIDPDAVIKEEIKEGKLFISYISDGREEKKAFRMDELEEKGYGRRDACKSCDTNIPTMADIACGNWGVPKEESEKKTFIEIFTDKGVEIVSSVMEGGYVEVEEASAKGIEIRKKIDERMRKLAEGWKERLDIVKDLSREERFKFYISTLRRCISCGACKEVCPVCACPGEDAKCVLLSDDRDSYLISMYDMVRLFHLMDSCIHCGQCEDVCPADIPLALIHRRFSDRMQERLGYRPGISIDERPPLYETKLMWKDTL